AGKAAVDVTFLVRPARAATLARDGLVITGALGELRLPVRTVASIAAGARYDLVLLSCKAYDLESAIEAIAPAVGPDTLVLPLLNGLDHFARLDARFGAARVLGGCCPLAASLGRDGVIAQLGPVQRIIYGARPGQAAHAAAALDRLHAA